MTRLVWSPAATSPSGQPLGPMFWDGDPEQPYLPGRGDDVEPDDFEWVTENLARDHARALRVDFEKQANG